MKILAVGGGSGGHVTPVAAVCKEIARRNDISLSDLSVTFVCDKAFEDQSRDIMATVPFDVDVQTIPSGKLRRYAHFRWWHYVRHFTIVLKNIGDAFKTVAGLGASVVLLMRVRPDVVFAKGGFVCLPVGLAARLLKIPLVIHDSDVRPGLTNRILARYAAAIGTGMPLENYQYNPDISRYIGVPINPDIVPTTAKLQAEYRRELGFDPKIPLIVSVGGGLGSTVINHATLHTAKKHPASEQHYLNMTGKAYFDSMEHAGRHTDSYTALGFVYKNVYKYLGAADIVVTRASATTLQELAGLQKTVIAVPAKQLGDQIKNAELFASYNAVVALKDHDLDTTLDGAIQELLADKTAARALAKSLHTFAKPEAARDMADMIVHVAEAHIGKTSKGTDA